MSEQIKMTAGSRRDILKKKLRTIMYLTDPKLFQAFVVRQGNAREKYRKLLRPKIIEDLRPPEIILDEQGIGK